MPVGIAVIVQNSAADRFVFGVDYTYLYNGGSAGSYSTVSPHVDLLFGKRTRPASSGLTLKGLFSLNAHSEPYVPFFLGLGFKAYIRNTARKKTPAFRAVTLRF